MDVLALVLVSAMPPSFTFHLIVKNPPPACVEAVGTTAPTMAVLPDTLMTRNWTFPVLPSTFDGKYPPS